MIGELRQERDQIVEAILTLERLAAGRGKRRGRPPAWMQKHASEENATNSGDNTPKRRGRPPGSKNKPKTKEAA